MANVKTYKAIKVSLEDKKNGTDLLDDKNINFNSFNIIYEPSLIPRCTLKISSPAAFPKIFYDIKNISLTIFHGEETYKFDIGIDTLKTKEAHILEIQGLLCDYDAFHDITSAYLGGSLEDAVIALKIREKVEGIDSISQDFYQIQENKVQALIRILNQASESSIFTLSDDSIIVKKINDNNDPKDQIMWTDIEYFSRNQKIKDLINSKTNMLQFEDDSSGLKMYTAFGKSFIDTIDNDTSMLNQTTSLPYRKFPADTMIKFKYYKSLFPYNIGDTMKIEDTSLYKGDSMFVLCKTMMFTVDDIYSDALMIGQSLSKE